MADTVEYLAERFPDLKSDDLGELRAIGHRYCRPAIPHGPIATPVATTEVEHVDEVNVA